MRITGFGLLIQLRPKDENEPGRVAGFNGAKTAILKKNVHIVIHDVGPSGILPGKAMAAPRANGRDAARPPLPGADADRPAQAEAPGPGRAPRAAVPTHDRQLLPRRRRPARQAGQPPDQLDCDDLRLTLLPDRESHAAPKAADPGPGPNAGTSRPPPAERPADRAWPSARPGRRATPSGSSRRPRGSRPAATS